MWFAHSMCVFYSRLHINFDIKSSVTACSTVEQSALFYLCYFLLSFFVGEAAFFFTYGTPPHYIWLKIRHYRCICCYCSCVWDCSYPPSEQGILGSQLYTFHQTYSFTLFCISLSSVPCEMKRISILKQCYSATPVIFLWILSVISFFVCLFWSGH